MTDTQVDADLDALVARPRKVKLGGKVYEVPGDIPMEVYIKVNLSGQKELDGDEEGGLGLMIDAIVDLVTWNAPETYKPAVREEVELAVRRFGVGAISRMIRVIYTDVTPEDKQDPQNPPSSEGGTTTTTS